MPQLYWLDYLQKFVVIKAFMHVLVSCKNEENPIKYEGSRVVKTCFPLLVYGKFIRRVFENVTKIWKQVAQRATIAYLKASKSSKYFV